MTHGTPRQTGRKRQTERQADETERKTGRDDTWDTQAGRDRQADRQTDRQMRQKGKRGRDDTLDTLAKRQEETGWMTDRAAGRQRQTDPYPNIRIREISALFPKPLVQCWYQTEMTSRPTLPDSALHSRTKSTLQNPLPHVVTYSFHGPLWEINQLPT